MEGKGEAEDAKEGELTRVCEEQRRQIADLESKLREKESEVVNLNTVLRQYSTKGPLTRLNPFIAISSPPKQPNPPIPGADFWDHHLEANEGNDYSFDDIAAKGLWILSSATERPIIASQTTRKPIIDRQRTIQEEMQRRRPTPYHPPMKSSSPLKEVSQDRGSYRDLVKPPALRLPQLQQGKPAKVGFKSVSPIKVKTEPQLVERREIKEPVYPVSQGQLRSALQPSQGIHRRGYPISPIKRAEVPLKNRKASFDPSLQRMDETLALRKPVKAVNINAKVRPSEVRDHYSNSPLRPKRLDPIVNGIHKSVSLHAKKPVRKA